MQWYFVGLSLFVSVSAIADSACWPEQKLLGTPTQSIIQSANYFLTAAANRTETTSNEPSLVTQWQNGICYAQHYQPESRQSLGLVACDALLCVNGECGTTDEFASLAVLQQSGDLLQVLQKNAPPVWLKWQTKPDWGMVPLWDNTEVGVPFAGDGQQIPLYQELGGKQVEAKSEHVFKVIQAIEYHGLTYLQLQRYLRLSPEDEPEIKLGAAVDVVYLQHRDQSGKLVSVLSRTWCD